MAELSERPNLGTTLTAELSRAGIDTVERLSELGSIESALAILRGGEDVCANKLYALEGAIRGVRWHSIPEEELRALWDRFTDAREGV